MNTVHTIVSQPSKGLKFMTFRERCLSYAIECKYLSEALKGEFRVQHKLGSDERA